MVIRHERSGNTDTHGRRLKIIRTVPDTDPVFALDLFQLCLEFREHLAKKTTRVFEQYFPTLLKVVAWWPSLLARCTETPANTQPCLVGAAHVVYARFAWRLAVPHQRAG